MASPKKPQNQPPQVPDYDYQPQTKAEREQNRQEARYWIKKIRQQAGLYAPGQRKFRRKQPAPAPPDSSQPDFRQEDGFVEDTPPDVREWLESQPAVGSEAETLPESNDPALTDSLPSPDLDDDRDDDIPQV